jgi:HAD superfamily hydrolase (TIGR01509 family)
MIKLIVFDLDGVLLESRDMHYEALNRSLEIIGIEYMINREEHLSTYDGLSTSKKLELLTKNKGLPSDSHDYVWRLKQDFTLKIIDTEYTYDERIRQILRCLKNEGYTIYVASNCIYNSVKMILLRKGYIEYIDYFLSNEDVSACKPNPEIYFKAMTRAGVGVKETIIIEDSQIGRKAALDSGAYLFPVESPADVNLKNILDFIKDKDNMTEERIKWKGKCNVVIPMSGLGSRFVKAGYTFPKPLIEVNSKPMIQVVVENLNIDPDSSTFIFIVQKSHIEKYSLKSLLNLIAPNCKIVETDGVTEGAACSILLAKQYIDNDNHLVLANSDQFLEWDSSSFMYSMTADDIDGGISTFESTHPKWSYAKLGSNGFVCEVAEKNPISSHATTGIYYFKHGRDFVKYAEQMISKDIRTNNEYYTCPVFNEMIKDGGKVKILDVDNMHSLGVPEDLEYFLSHHNKQ